jgi:hypothetical protein
LRARIVTAGDLDAGLCDLRPVNRSEAIHAASTFYLGTQRASISAPQMNTSASRARERTTIILALSPRAGKMPEKGSKVDYFQAKQVLNSKMRMKCFLDSPFLTHFRTCHLRNPGSFLPKIPITETSGTVLFRRECERRAKGAKAKGRQFRCRPHIICCHIIRLEY